MTHWYGPIEFARSNLDGIADDFEKLGNYEHMPRKKVEDSGRLPPPDEMLKFPERLSKALKLRNVKRIALAEKSKVDAGTISRWINGKGWQTASAARISRLAMALDVSLDWLLLGDEPIDRGVRDDSFAVLFEDSERGDRVALQVESRISLARERTKKATNKPVASNES